MKAMHDLDTDYVQWINDSGNLWRGKAAVHKGHDAIHRTIFANTSMSGEQTDIRAIAPDVAVAVATLHSFTLTDLKASRKTSNYRHTSQRPILLLRQKHAQC